MKKVIKFDTTGNRAHPFYILWVLENYSSEKCKLKQSDIVRILETKHNYKIERKSVGENLHLLDNLGYNVKGLEGRGGVWLEKDIGDEQLQMLIDNVLFSNYIAKEEAEDLIDNLISLGGSDLKKKSAKAQIDGGRIYHQDSYNFFKEVAKIKQAMTEENGTTKRIKFDYTKYAYQGDHIELVKKEKHEVSPYFFVQKKGYYYLVAYNHKADALWHYRLEYVQNVEIMSSYAKNQNDTELKNKTRGEYVSEHPYMFAGKSETITVKVLSSKLSLVVETFGDNMNKVSEDADYTLVEVRCTQLDAFYWATQFGDYIEVLKPQKLRNDLRNHVESMFLKYSQGDGDKYEESIRLAKRERILNLEGIDLRGKTKHFSIKSLHSLSLSNNNIDNIDFIKSMRHIRRLKISNNNIKSLEPVKNLRNVRSYEVENLPIEKLEMPQNEEFMRLHFDLPSSVDMSELKKVKKVVFMTFSERCTFNDTIPWDYFDANKDTLPYKIVDRESEDVNTNARDSYNSYYPYNIMRKVLGHDVEFVGNHDEICKAVDKIVDKLSKKEQTFINLKFKDRISDLEIKKQMQISWEEMRTIYDSAIRQLCLAKNAQIFTSFTEPTDENKNYTIDSHPLSKKIKIKK